MKRSLLYSLAILSAVSTGCAKLQEDLLEADIASEQVIMPDPSNNFVTIKQISTFAERVAPETKYGGEGGFE